MEKKFTVKEKERNAELQSFVTVFEKVDRKEIPDGWLRFRGASDNAVEEQGMCSNYQPQNRRPELASTSEMPV